MTQHCTYSNSVIKSFKDEPISVASFATSISQVVYLSLP